MYDKPRSLISVYKALHTFEWNLSLKGQAQFYLMENFTCFLKVRILYHKRKDELSFSLIPNLGRPALLVVAIVESGQKLDYYSWTIGPG